MRPEDQDPGDGTARSLIRDAADYQAVDTWEDCPLWTLPTANCPMSGVTCGFTFLVLGHGVKEA